MATTELVVSRTVNASIGQVWQAWTDPAELMQWYSPENMTTPLVEVDLREGGSYRVTMKGDEGERIVAGTYQEVTEPNRLVFSWQWEGSAEAATTVTVELKEVADDKTEVTLRHKGFVEETSRAMHVQGWESTLNHLESHL